MSTSKLSSPIPTARTAIVTGASRGIGRAIALRLAADGFRVAVNYAGNTAKAREVVSAIQVAGGEAIAVQADVSQADEVQRLFATTLEAFGDIGAVVHSAGAMSLAPIAPDSVDIFDRVIQTNLRGAFLVLGHAAQHLQAGGRITVNAVAPGPVATELFLEGKTDEQISRLIKAVPLERLGQPEDIARVVSFLVGADGGWVNSQIVRANGGFA